MQKYTAVPLMEGGNLVGAAGSAAKTYNGGQGVLVIEVGTYGDEIHLQLQHTSGNWINAHSGIVLVDQVIPLSLPAGQYRMFATASSAIGVYATLCPTP